MTVAADPVELMPGVVQEIRPGVRRLVAPNPGRMTGPGTNTYLIGDRRVVVLDPGPAIDAHLAAIAAAIGSASVAAVAVTHTHMDHSPAAAAVSRAFGAPRVGLLPRWPDHQDLGFVPDQLATEGRVLHTDAGSLVAIETPGHASNHVCWWQRSCALLYTGDHILGTTSPVIRPPDGDLAAYLRSLERLVSVEASALAPAHGPLLNEPRQVIEQLLGHRLAREARVLDALAGCQPRHLDDVLTDVYRDVDPALHDIARHSLLAHLIKLRNDGRVLECDGHWKRL